MRKTLLLGTILFVATSAWALGGFFGGHKSHNYSGVDAVGVHYNGDDKKPDINIRGCDSKTEELVGTECCPKTLVYDDNGVAKCCSMEGYVVQDGQCKKQCAEGLALNEETNECEDACPAIRRCGETCCGEGNICVDGNKCCVEGYVGNENMCCDATKSTGWAGDFGYGVIENERCCDTNSTPYISYREGDDVVGISCCPNNLQIFTPDMIAFQTGVAETRPAVCCPEGTTGYQETDGECCEAGTIMLEDVDAGEAHCCPAGSTGYTAADGCCEAGTIVIQDENEEKHCCPANSTGFDTDSWECI